MNIAYLTNAEPTSGVGYYADRLAKALSRVNQEVTPLHLGNHRLTVNGEEKVTLSRWPSVLANKSIGWMRIQSTVKAELKRISPDIVHATNQTLSFISHPFPSVVTVHDIIEMLEPQDSRAYMINRYLYRGIAKAAHIIAVSEYTKQTVIKYYGIPETHITVIPNGIGSEFRPLGDGEQTQSLRQTYSVPADVPVVLFVGSEHPRKNIRVALESFSRFIKQYPQAIFLKVGDAGIQGMRAETLSLVDSLGIRDAVRFVGHVSYEELNELYNLSTMLVFPSRFEGFGLPPLQAMAAGLPVVAAKASSVPEIVGDAAVLVELDDIDAFTAGMKRVVEDKEYAKSLRFRGTLQAKKFSWDDVARRTVEVYRKCI